MLGVMELPYLAGFFDADGGVSLRTRSDSPHSCDLTVYVSQTTTPVLEDFRENFGGRLIGPHSNGANSKPIYRWEASSRQAQATLEALLPWLVVKLPQAAVALEYRRVLNPVGVKISAAERERRKALVRRMKNLNRRGLCDTVPASSSDTQPGGGSS